MDQTLSKQCTRCGAAGAELYANDGALVCDTCFSYDQIVTGDLRASQEHLGMIPTGEVSGLVEGAEHTWHRAAAGAVVMAIVSGALMAFALSMDELIVTYFTSSSSSATLPLRIYGMAKVGLNPMINALSTLFIVATIVLLVASEWVKRLRR